MGLIKPCINKVVYHVGRVFRIDVERIPLPAGNKALYRAPCLITRSVKPGKGPNERDSSLELLRIIATLFVIIDKVQ